MKRCELWIIPALSVLAALVIVATLAAPSAEAIPAFARKYSMSCTTCHAPVPRLKEGDPIHNEAWMAGGDATIAWANGSVNVQYLRRNDDDPAFLLDPGDEIVTQGGLTEVVLLPHGDRSRWYCAALYNRIDSDLDVYDNDTITGHIGYLVRTNIRLTLENTYDIEDEENRLVMGVITAF